MIQFLTEAVLISLMGGIVGIILGILVWQYRYDPDRWSFSGTLELDRIGCIHLYRGRCIQWIVSRFKSSEVGSDRVVEVRIIPGRRFHIF